MSWKSVLQSAPVNHRQPVGTCKSTHQPKEKRRFAEVAGSTAAECAAICCCCPCSVLNLLILTCYRMPLGLCKKTWLLRKKKKKKNRRCIDNEKRLFQQRSSSIVAVDESTVDGLESDVKKVTDVATDENVNQRSSPPSNSSSQSSDSDEFENEMWVRFHGTGFWRSPSQRDT